MLLLMLVISIMIPYCDIMSETDPSGRNLPITVASSVATSVATNACSLLLQVILAQEVVAVMVMRL